jgi:hypothetical protein
MNSKKENDLYYIQDSRNYVGNSPLWWGENYGGYTCDIDKAGLYTKDEAMKLFDDRSTDIPWKKEDVEKAIRKTVDSQYLKKDDADGFYSQLEKKREEIRIQDKLDYEKAMLGQYIKDELFDIKDGAIDNICSESIPFEKFDELFDEFKSNAKYEFIEYYFPIAYNKTSKEIFNDLIKYEYLTKCKICNKLHNDDYLDDQTCEECWEEE